MPKKTDAPLPPFGDDAYDGPILLALFFGGIMLAVLIVNIVKAVRGVGR